jgi:inhibitor of cysteine peptidase
MQNVKRIRKEVLTMKFQYFIPIVLLLLVVACVPPKEPIVAPVKNSTPIKEEPVQGTEPVNTEPRQVEFASGAPIKFNSSDEVLEYLQNAKSTQGQSTLYYGRGVMAEDSMVGMAGGAKMAAPSAAPATTGSNGGTSATDYSHTNVQVQGVDEADIVKNDGKYIYILNQEKLVIMDAYPANKAQVVFEDDITGRPQNLFVSGDRLVIFVDDNSEVYRVMPYEFMPYPSYVQQTKVLVYDIKDRSKPELVKDYKISGNYYQSRMIGDYVYFVVQNYVNSYDYYVDLPMIKEGSSVAVRPEIWHFDNVEDNFAFTTVASFNIKTDSEKITAKSFLMGYANTMYVSEDNIYIAYQKTMPWGYYDTDREDRFFAVVVPLLPKDVRSQIEDIKDSNEKSYAKWIRISEVMQEMYDGMSANDREDLSQKIYDAIAEYEAKREAEYRKTVIHKLAIDKGDIDYVASGEVSGNLLNQFSLDEYKSDLRVATTTELWSGKQQLYNNVYTLDKDMKVIGTLEKLAPDERIYSTRFMGDRLYMVTFKRVDPLFVIDLSDAKNPAVLGKLKIPGFSDYLHPYDATHIIGIGKETEGNDWGGVSVKGLKLALFDVTDVENPKLLDSYEIGDSGTDSEALHDHKAFLFDKEKNILVLPVREVKESRIYDSRYGYYREKVWQGVYVFGLTPKDGFELKGKVSHQESYEQYGYWYYSGNQVRRSLFMDDVLYTVSGKLVKMNDLNNIDKELGTVDLPYNSDQPWIWY